MEKRLDTGFYLRRLGPLALVCVCVCVCGTVNRVTGGGGFLFFVRSGSRSNPVATFQCLLGFFEP